MKEGKLPPTPGRKWEGTESLPPSPTREATMSPRRQREGREREKKEEGTGPSLRASLSQG